ncbi:unnamed protein product, partial [Didymodactylos carnosus]
SGKRIRALVDTGATHSFITQGTLGKLRHSPIHSSKSTAHLADQNTSLKILGEVKLNIRVNDVTTPITALVVKSLNADFILGGNWCHDTGARIEYDKQQVSIRSYYGRSYIPYDKQIDTLALDLKLLNSVSIPPRESIVVQAKLDLSSAQFAYFYPDIDLQQSKCISMPSALLKIDKYSTFLEIYNPTEFSRTLYKNATLGQVTYTPPNVANFDAFENSASLNRTSPSVNSIITSSTSTPGVTFDKLTDHLNDPSQKQQIRQILNNHAQIFDISKITQARTNIRHTINTGDSLPISSCSYPKTIQQRREMQEEIPKMMQNGQIRPSNSPWSSPVIIHKKKDGGIRFLVDYRKLNCVTKKDSFPQP